MGFECQGDSGRIGGNLGKAKRASMMPFLLSGENVI